MPHGLPIVHVAMQPASAPVRNWLIVVAAMIFFMIVLGALTRLTESGLSMVEWRPVTGWLPPLGDSAWHAELASRIDPAAEPWASLSAAAGREAAQRHRLQAAMVAARNFARSR